MNSVSNQAEIESLRRDREGLGAEDSELRRQLQVLEDRCSAAGARLCPVSGAPYEIAVFVSFANDRNQYLGLKDVDNDGRPDLVDDFPENAQYWIDSDNDGYDDTDPLEWDIDGDGITDTLDSCLLYTSPSPRHRG